MDRVNDIIDALIKLRLTEIININNEDLVKWAKIIDESISDKTTGNDVIDFCNEFVIGDRDWIKSKGISNIITFPLRAYTEKEVQERRNKLGLS